MKTLELTNGQETKRKVIFINFTNTKRLQWNRYRRYA